MDDYCAARSEVSPPLPWPTLPTAVLIDAAGFSFVSITQAFDATTSMEG